MILVDLTDKVTIDWKTGHKTFNHLLYKEYTNWCRENIPNTWSMSHELDGSIYFYFDIEEEAVLFKLIHGV